MTNHENFSSLGRLEDSEETRSYRPAPKIAIPPTGSYEDRPLIIPLKGEAHTHNFSVRGGVRSQDDRVRRNGNYRGDSRKNRPLIFLPNS
ncbi:MAG: hypothetical protein F6K18_32750 [Okeania sp. SIO2C2]|uniref:hypothetical protein n=1 Tax=Okeania sp. SIO2C2 TaxID=2607787 RepID=UPI0013B8851E|nr:hypothetical protein [Okeania sp. SIO2C2]NEP91189.1 hypothetical protein [Okeania sp. SIO2C2]